MRNRSEWEVLYGALPEHYLPAGDLAVYNNRGWCRLELVAALCPKKFHGGSKFLPSDRQRNWRPGPIGLRYRFHHQPDVAGAGPVLGAHSLKDPRCGAFTNDDDRATIKPVLERIAARFSEYEECGATSWDRTLNVARRPQWLKEVGEAGPLSYISASAQNLALPAPDDPVGDAPLHAAPNKA